MVMNMGTDVGMGMGMGMGMDMGMDVGMGMGMGRAVVLMMATEPVCGPLPQNGLSGVTVGYLSGLQRVSMSLKRSPWALWGYTGVSRGPGSARPCGGGSVSALCPSPQG